MANPSQIQKRDFYLLLAFLPITGLVLFFDSTFFLSEYPYGQWLSNIFSSLYLLLLLFHTRRSRWIAALFFLPFAWIGEAVFSLVLGLYHYRLDYIPLYVPVGHSILLCVGLLLTDWVENSRHPRVIQYALLIFHISLITCALLVKGDTFSALFGAVFFLALPYGRRITTFSLIIGLLVFYVEVLGTIGQSWHWETTSFGVLQTVNPPFGAFVFYVVGKLIILQWSNSIQTKWNPALSPTSYLNIWFNKVSKRE